MRKSISIILLTLISVLSVWGEQNQSAPPPLDISNVQHDIDSLKKLQSDVVDQALTISALTEEDKNNLEETLDATFSEAQKVIDSYSSLSDEYALQQNRVAVLYRFISRYGKDIRTSPNNVGISTSKFLTTAKLYRDSLKNLNAEFDEWKKSHSDSGIDGFDGADLDNPDNTEDPTNTVKKDFEITGIWAILLILFDIIALILAITIFYKAKELQKNIRNAEERIDILEKKLVAYTDSTNTAGTTTKHSAYRGAAANVHTKNTAQHDPYANSTKDPAVLTPNTYSQQVADRQQQPVQKPKDTRSFLYALANSKNPTTLNKVTEDNKGDKVFMLVLDNPEAEIAELTIVPDMSADRLNAVIADKETYLPANLCEVVGVAPNASRISVLRPGVVKKSNGVWQIQDRMQINLV